MIKSLIQCRAIQARRAAQGKPGVARAVRRFFKRERAACTYTAEALAANYNALTIYYPAAVDDKEQSVSCQT